MQLIRVDGTRHLKFDFYHHTMSWPCIYSGHVISSSRYFLWFYFKDGDNYKYKLLFKNRLT